MHVELSNFSQLRLLHLAGQTIEQNIAEHFEMFTFVQVSKSRYPGIQNTLNNKLGLSCAKLSKSLSYLIPGS